MKSFFKSLWEFIKGMCFVVLAILGACLSIPFVIAFAAAIPIFCVALVILLPPVVLALGIICLPIYCFCAISQIVAAEIKLIRAKHEGIEKCKQAQKEVDNDISSTKGHDS